MSKTFEGFTDKQVEALELLQGPQRHTCLVGGARSGKTFVLTYSTVYRALHNPNSRHAIFRLTANSVRHAIARDTLPNVMRLTTPNTPYEMHWQVALAGRLPRASQRLANLDARVSRAMAWRTVGRQPGHWTNQEFGLFRNPDTRQSIPDPESIYFNECSQIRYATVQLVRNRLAQVIPGLRQRAYYDIRDRSLDEPGIRLIP